MSKIVKRTIELEVDNRGTLYPTRIELDGDWVRITQTYQGKIMVVALDNDAMAKLVEEWVGYYFPYSFSLDDIKEATDGTIKA